MQQALARSQDTVSCLCPTVQAAHHLSFTWWAVPLAVLTSAAFCQQALLGCTATRAEDLPHKAAQLPYSEQLSIGQA
jgi:hypothetical protein